MRTTIHMLSRGLDSEDILYHALPKPEKVDLFILGMKAVKVAHDSLVERIGNEEIFKYQGIPQDRTKEYRYTKNKEFTDEVAKKYMEDMYSPEKVYKRLENRDFMMFENPFIN